MSMTFLAKVKKKTCNFEEWLKLVDNPELQTNKHGLKLIFAMESADGQSIYDVGETETMEGVEDFVSDPEEIKMHAEAGVDVESQEVVSAVGDFKIFRLLISFSSLSSSAQLTQLPR